MNDDTLRVCVVFPDLLGTYGDGGNGLVLARRAAWRGIAVDLVHASSERPLPTADLYCLGGGEDGPEVRAARALASSGSFVRAVEHGATVLAVCAGYQIMGASFPDARGITHPGVGLLDAVTERGQGVRAVGEVLAQPLPITAPTGGPPVALPVLSGFENHASTTRLGQGAAPLATVVSGSGNGDGSGSEGAWSGSVMGTYLHGPVLARNPALADVLLSWATGSTPLEPLDDTAEAELRRERLSAVRPRRFDRLIRRFG
jgi:lipid II isoglutaminyl synthase (glutamine-hydrolysing)